MIEELQKEQLLKELEPLMKDIEQLSMKDKILFFKLLLWIKGK